MRCKHKATKSRCKYNERSNIGKIGQKSEKCNTNDLENIGRKQFFYHYPYSKLPIRVIARTKDHQYGKTEPHIEIGAENYLRCCIQSNIRGFCNSAEKFLFLCTECKNKELKKFIGKRFVVGYIEKKYWKKLGDDQLAVFGKTYIVPFDEKLGYKKLGFMGKSYTKKLDKKETKQLLKLIHSHKNIINKCIKEMVKQENIERKKGNKYIPHDEECLKDKCSFKIKNECLRWK